MTSVCCWVAHWCFSGGQPIENIKQWCGRGSLFGFGLILLLNPLFPRHSLTTSIPLHPHLPSSSLLPSFSPLTSPLWLCVYPLPSSPFHFSRHFLPSSPFLSSLHQVSSCIKAQHESGQVELGQSGPSSVFSRLGASNSTRKLDFEEFNLGRILEPDYVNYMRFYFINL